MTSAGLSARRRLEPGGRRDEPAVGAAVTGRPPRIRRDGVLRGQPDPPAQCPRLEVHRIEVVVPRADVYRVADHGRRRRHGVARRVEPGLLQRADRGLRQRRPPVEGVLGVVPVPGPVPGVRPALGMVLAAGRTAAPCGCRPAEDPSAGRRQQRRAERQGAHRPSDAPGCQSQREAPSAPGWVRNDLSRSRLSRERSRRDPCPARGSPTALQRRLDLPRRVGTARPRRDAHGHAGREVEPARHGHRRGRLAVGGTSPASPGPRSSPVRSR